jgi:predicted negative regulator of RcsB-dependent stress response
MEANNLDKAKALILAQTPPAGFKALFDDRLGDIAVLQGQPEEAKALFLSAYQALEDANEYRRIIDIKLATLGAAPAAAEKKQ